jgi:Ca-activated chloride channel homolog
MKFATPTVLWTLLLLPALVGVSLAAARNAQQLVQKLVAARLHAHLVGEVTGRTTRLVLLLAGLALALLALARPQWGEVESENRGRGRDVIIVVDVSRSMLATDLPPNRLQRAKLAAEDLVRQLPADRVGLVAFAGSAFLQAPVTSDHSAVLSAIHELDPEIIPLPGTNVSGALRCADDAFDRSEGGQRAIVLITDGEDLEADAVALAQELSAKMRIFTVGVGSPEGAVLMVPSPKGGMEYIRDADGNVVQSKLDENRLLQIAEAGGGFYSRLLSGPAEMRRIAQEGIDHMDEHEVHLQTQTHAVDRYQWPLGGALLLLSAGLFLAEKPRRKLAGTLALVLLSLSPAGAPRAEAAASLGHNLYNAGNYAGAQEAFGDELKGDPDSPQRAFNFGVAAYKNKKWAEAIDAFGKALATQDPQLRSRAEYNLANTLVQQASQGRRGQDDQTLEQAISHYDESSKRDPSFEDAKVNRDYVRRLLEQKKEQQKQDKGDDGKKDKNKKDKDKNKGDKKEGQDEKGEQDDKDDKDKDSKQESQDSDDKKGEQGQDKEQGKKEGKEGKEGREKGDKPGQDSTQNGQPPKPVEEKPGEQKERGDLKDAPTVDKPDKGPNPEKEAQIAQGGDGKMTREQAAALMEALRSEDRRVQVWAPDKQEGPSRERKTKTW